MANAPLAQWRVFLHPQQRKLAVGDRGGPVRILGGAGTGKTVLALHRARWLAKQRCPAGQKVLVTTYTRNLATDIEQNLKSLFLDDPDFQRIEVCNLDRWVHRFLHQRRYGHRIIYERDAEAWGRALETRDRSLGLEPEFYAAEWDQLVAPQGLRTLDDYRKASRVGRHGVLNRSRRDAVWPVFEEYRAQLSARQLKQVDDAYGDTASLLRSEREQGAANPYAAIVIDETQDFGAQALRLLRALVPEGPNDLYFVGDGHQRIYPRHRAVLGRCGIDIRGRARKLYLNYRTTEEIRRLAVGLLEGRDIDDLDGGSDDNRRYKSLSHGAVPERISATESAEACRIAVARAVDWVRESGNPPSICVIVPTKHERDRIARDLGALGIEARVVEADTADTGDPRAVRVATMHRAKGLEFDRVIVLDPATATAESAALCYVALTRARAVALLVSVG
jgi:superfamily I DNA/RNA helicase